MKVKKAIEFTDDMRELRKELGEGLARLYNLEEESGAVTRRQVESFMRENLGFGFDTLNKTIICLGLSIAYFDGRIRELDV